MATMNFALNRFGVVCALRCMACAGVVYGSGMCCPSLGLAAPFVDTFKDQSHLKNGLETATIKVSAGRLVVTNKNGGYNNHGNAVVTWARDPSRPGVEGGWSLNPENQQNVLMINGMRPVTPKGKYPAKLKIVPYFSANGVTIRAATNTFIAVKPDKHGDWSLDLREVAVIAYRDNCQKVPANVTWMVEFYIDTTDLDGDPQPDVGLSFAAIGAGAK